MRAGSLSDLTDRSEEKSDRLLGSLQPPGFNDIVYTTQTVQ